MADDLVQLEYFNAFLFTLFALALEFGLVHAGLIIINNIFNDRYFKHNLSTELEWNGIMNEKPINSF